MTCQPAYRRVAQASALVACLFTLPACGGSDGSGVIVSAPPPPSPTALSIGIQLLSSTPLAPAPAWKTGTYDAIFVDSDHLASESDPASLARTASIGVDEGTKTYSLTVTGGQLDVPTMTLRSPPLNPSPGNIYFGTQIGNRITYETVWSDGADHPDDIYTLEVREGNYSGRVYSAADKFIQASLGISGNAANSYVSLAYWQADENQIEAAGYHGVRGSVGYSAFGDRTAPSSIPTSGTATYRVTDFLGNEPYFAELTIDFARMLMSLGYTIEEQFDFYREGAIPLVCNEEACAYDSADREGTTFLTSAVSGDGSVRADGSFAIPLAGMGTVRTSRIDQMSVPEVHTQLSGQVAGALFGPNAAEAGGVFQLPKVSSDGTATQVTGAFTAAQSGP